MLCSANFAHYFSRYKPNQAFGEKSVDKHNYEKYSKPITLIGTIRNLPFVANINIIQKKKHLKDDEQVKLSESKYIVSGSYVYPGISDNEIDLGCYTRLESQEEVISPRFKNIVFENWTENIGEIEVGKSSDSLYNKSAIKATGYWTENLKTWKSPAGDRTYPIKIMGILRGELDLTKYYKDNYNPKKDITRFVYEDEYEDNISIYLS